MKPFPPVSLVKSNACGSHSSSLARSSVMELVVVLLLSLFCLLTYGSEPKASLHHFHDCDACSEMISLPAGDYYMGATTDDFRGFPNTQFSYLDETPRHEVHVKPFALGQFSVTKAQFSVFARETGFSGQGCRIYSDRTWHFDPTADWQNPGFNQTDRDPVVCVSWSDAQRFISWINSRLPPGIHTRYRLPTEEEWEYAARAGTVTPMYWGSDRGKQCQFENARDETASDVGTSIPFARCNDGYRTTSPVGSFRPNPWGFFDMLGNASQWAAECPTIGYHVDAASSTTALPCRTRALRGASWASIPIAVRSANRSGLKPDIRMSTVGFRLAADPLH